MSENEKKEAPEDAAPKVEKHPLRAGIIPPEPALPGDETVPVPDLAPESERKPAKRKGKR